MKTFTESEVATIVRKSVLETMNGVVDWIKEEKLKVTKTAKKSKKEKEVEE